MTQRHAAKWVISALAGSALLVTAGCGSRSQGLVGTWVSMKANLEAPPVSAPSRLLLVVGMSNTLAADFATGFRQHLAERLQACGITSFYQPVPVFYGQRASFFDSTPRQLSDSEKKALEDAKRAVGTMVKTTNSDTGILVVETSKHEKNHVPDIVSYDVSVLDYKRNVRILSGQETLSPNPFAFIGENSRQSGEYFADHLLIDLADKGAVLGCRPPLQK